MEDCASVLRFWFEESTPQQWFEKNADFDRVIEERFGDLHQEASNGGHDDWAKSANGALALILVLDQFSRNLFRDDPRAFAQDGKALSLAREAISKGQDKEVSEERRVFFYVPFEHSEDLADQEESLPYFESLSNPEYLRYAIAHRDIIARFGRFPHRNDVMGRESTAEEIAFLKTPGSSF
ncbi:DUF924 domain-containing protein [Hwanghaeella grinnelliae]|uniref:DUF924 domain-containing protein n=1 Tax=Hwanghaeella grinnelliae TaxID=2500179 RepID=A0A3S2VL19_9PROT|nr:DUF924 family protein [Hwanghaeella grinnelliae]RVU34695.1 DUF924 domain-containing protein [Hwanghaeella grinnelliae]